MLHLPMELLQEMLQTISRVKVLVGVRGLPPNTLCHRTFTTFRLGLLLRVFKFKMAWCQTITSLIVHPRLGMMQSQPLRKKTTPITLLIP